jgi:hypothetical protein
MLERLVNKIHGLSRKKKVIIFLSLFVLSFAWVLFRNPVYIDTTAYVFPIEDTGDGRVYWGIKNGYNTVMADTIPDDAFYSSVKDVSGSSITVENKENNSFVEKIDIKSGINFYDLKGDIVHFERFTGIEETLELPRKEGIRLLIVKNGESVELLFSSIQVYYQKQLLNRDVAATFPFYLAYTTGRNIAFDKAIPDTELYDVSFERRQWFSDYYLDPAMPHYIAKNFNRAINFPFGRSKLLLGMSFLAALSLSCFLFFVPYHLLKAFTVEGNNKLLFIGLALYLIIMWLIFRHSMYFARDSVLPHVVNMTYSSFFTHLYMISEYIFFLIGYSSKVFFMILQLCIIIWNYEKILSKYLSSIIGKVSKYILILIPLLSPCVILLTMNNRRDVTAFLWVIMGYMYFYNYYLDKNRKIKIISVLCLLVAVACRIDYVLFFIPYFLYFIIKKITFKRVLFTGFLGIIVLIYAFLAGQGSNNEPWRRLDNDIYQVDYSLVKHRASLSENEERIISDIYDGGMKSFLDELSLRDSVYLNEGKGFQVITKSDVIKFDHAALTVSVT